MLTVTIEGIPDVERAWAQTVREIHYGTTVAVQTAADAGVEELPQAMHITEDPMICNQSVPELKARCAGPLNLFLVGLKPRRSPRCIPERRIRAQHRLPPTTR